MRVKRLFKICSNRNTANLRRQPHGKRAEEDPADCEGLERLAAAYLEHFGEVYGQIVSWYETYLATDDCEKSITNF